MNILSRKIFSINRKKPYYLFTVLFTGIMLVAYPFLQSFGNVDIWFAVIEPWNLALYLVFSVLFGLLVSFQIYTKREVKTCSIKKSAGTGTLGTVAGFLVAQCPSCAVLLSLFLPFNAIIFIVTYNAWLTLASLGLLLFGIHTLGGFQKEAATGTARPSASRLPDAGSSSAAR